MTYSQPSTSLARRGILRLGLAGAAAAVVGRHAAPIRAAENTMRTRAIPSSGEEVPIVGLGTYRTFDVPAGRAAGDQREVLRLFFEAGGRVVDSSPMYGNAERVVGELAAELGIVSELFLATKVWTRGREQGIEQMERSAALLRDARIDLMQVHNLVDLRTHLETLKRWKEEGRIRYLGITHYTASMHDELARLAESEPLDFLQFNYNILERNAENRLLPAARDRGVATLINEPFEKGTLFGQVRGRDLPPWVAEFDCASWAQFFLKFILGHPAVSCVIPATSKPKHVSDNVRAGYGALPDAAQRERMADLMANL